MKEPLAEVTFACQECGKSISFPADRRGHVEDCPYCGNYVDVPYATETALREDEGGSQKALGDVPRTTAQLWIEVLAVLCLAYVPPMFSAVVAFNGIAPADNPYSFAYDMWYWIVSALRVSLPLLLILALTGESWSTFGIVRPTWLLDAVGTFAIWFTGVAALYAAYSIVPPEMHKGSVFWPVRHSMHADGIAERLLLSAACIAGGFSEELVMRGYLIPRFERLLRSTPVAIFVTSILFASYHLYQGITPVIADFAFGTVYAIWFCTLRRLWPLCLAHAFHNFLLHL